MRTLVVVLLIAAAVIVFLLMRSRTSSDLNVTPEAREQIEKAKRR